MNIITEKQNLFDEDFNCISNDTNKLIQFCDVLRSITGIQVCNHSGMRYEYLPEVYRSVVKANEMQSM